MIPGWPRALPRFVDRLCRIQDSRSVRLAALRKANLARGSATIANPDRWMSCTVSQNLRLQFPDRVFQPRHHSALGKVNRGYGHIKSLRRFLAARAVYCGPPKCLPSLFLELLADALGGGQ